MDAVTDETVWFCPSCDAEKIEEDDDDEMLPKMAKKISNTGRKMERIEPEVVAKALGAEIVNRQLKSGKSAICEMGDRNCYFCEYKDAHIISGPCRTCVSDKRGGMTNFKKVGEE